MNNLSHVLITGGSTGIGRELAFRFAASGHHLFLVALPEPALEETAADLRQQHPQCTVHTLALDLTEPNALDTLQTAIQDAGFPVDVLVNNAGFGTWGYLPHVGQAMEEKMIQLNILALYRLTRHFLQDMRQEQRGVIMNIASIAAFQPNPYMATYGASKAFVRSFSQALDQECRDQGENIRVLTVCPPAARTPFQDRAGMGQSALFRGWLAVDAPLVADAAFRAYRQRRHLMIPGRKFRLIRMLTNLLPESFRSGIARHTLRQRLPSFSRD